MGLLGGLAGLIAERSAYKNDPSAIETVPGTNQYSGQPSDVARLRPQDPFLIDLIRTLQDRTTSTAANKIGLPGAAGLTRDQVAELLQTKEVLPYTQALRAQTIESKQNEDTTRTDRLDLDRAKFEARKKAESRLGALKKDPLFEMANQNMMKLAATNPLVGFEIAADPEKQASFLEQQFSILKNVKSGKLGQKKPSAGAATPDASSPAASVQPPSGAANFEDYTDIKFSPSTKTTWGTNKKTGKLEKIR